MSVYRTIGPLILYYVENAKKATAVDPDENANYEPSHLDLQCLQIQLLLCLANCLLSNKTS